MLIIVVMGFFICSIGLQNGLEKVTKVMMVALLAIMVILAINSFFMKGAKEGLSFYLIPSIERAKAAGIGNTAVGAMNQAFFTLSIEKAANVINTKNKLPQTLPKGMLLKIFGNVIKTRLGPCV